MSPAFGRAHTGQGVNTAPLKLFLHVGLPKTGSTSIQLRLFENAAAAREKGFLYPLGRFPERPFQHSDLRLLVAPERAGELQALLQGIRDEAISAGCHSVIVSGEALSLLAGARLTLLRDALLNAHFATTVIVFFRPLVDFARSLAAEQMRTRQSILSASRLAEQLARHDEESIVSRFATAFGRDNVVSHILNSDDDAVALFDRDIGLSADFPVSRHNERFDFATLTWLNAIQDELDIPTGIIYRNYRKAFAGRAPFLAAETAFLSEVAGLIGGEKGRLLQEQLNAVPSSTDDFGSIESRLQYIESFIRFISGLRWYLKRKAFRQRVARLLGRSRTG